jgi:hypothetical protein
MISIRFLAGLFGFLWGILGFIQNPFSYSPVADCDD